jgi:ribosomal protein S6
MKFNAESEDVISQNRRQNHGRAEMGMRTALERRLGYGLLKTDRGHYWIWDFCDRRSNLEKKSERDNSEVVLCIRV